MNTQNNTPDNEIRQKYFLISKRWTVTLVLLALVTYGCAVIWSEFVYSVGGPRATYKSQFEKLGCTPLKLAPGELPYLKNDGNQYPNRQILLLDRTRVFGEYIDILSNHPECVATEILANVGDPRGLVFIYYDRTTDKPVVKVTIESID